MQALGIGASDAPKRFELDVTEVGQKLTTRANVRRGLHKKLLDGIMPLKIKGGEI